MSRSDATDPSSIDPGDGGSAKPVDTDQWAKAVVDGLRIDQAAPAEPVGDDANTNTNANADGAPDHSGDTEDGGEGTWSVDEAYASATAAAGQPGETADPSADDATTGGTAPADENSPPAEISVEDLVLDLERVTTERDQYLDASRRLQAEFENYKKQVLKREVEARERANDSLVGELLPVLDAFDGAVANGAEDMVPMRASFLDALGKHGLERIEPTDVPFDPTVHEAVMHEEATDTDGPVVAEVMRAGYVWKGRVLRPAMVRTRG